MQIKEQIIGLQEEITAIQDEIILIDEEMKGAEELYHKQLTQLSRLNRLKRNKAQFKGHLGRLKASVASTKAEISEVNLALLLIDQNLKAEASNEIRNIENRQAELIEQERKVLEELNHIEIKSPI